VLSPWRDTVRAIVRLERAQLHPLLGLSFTLGVAIPLVAGITPGQAGTYAFASAAALAVGFGGFLGIYRTKAATMLAATLSIALSLFVGSVGGRSPALMTGLVLLWGFAAGLLGVFGPAAYFVGLQAVLYLLLGSGLPVNAHDALTRALFALGGGVLQTLLVVGVWPLRHFVAERRALGEAYRALAGYARGPLQRGMPPPPLMTSGIYRALADPHPFGDRSTLARFQRLLDEAERLRMSLAALAPPHASQWQMEGPIAALVAACSDVLDAIASAVETARAPVLDDPAWQTLRSVESALSAPGGTMARPTQIGTPPAEVLRAQVAALLAQLRAAWRLAAATGGEMPVPPMPLPRPARFPAMRTIARSLRASLSLRSSTFRHALRLAVVVALATAAYQMTTQPYAYWLPIAALLVLQPAFAETLNRGLGMMLGTVAGAAAATLLASVWRPEHASLVALMLVFAWACFTTFRANYALFAACITAYIVFLTATFGLPEPVAALNRVVSTVMGGSLALLAFVLWPTWEARKVPERLAAMLEAQGRYAATMLSRFALPDPQPDVALARARMSAQVARVNAEDSVERMLAEPRSGPRREASVALGILAAVRTFAVAALALDGARTGVTCPPWPDLRSMAAAIDQALAGIAHAVRSGNPPANLPPLREMHLAFVDGVESASRLFPEAAAGRPMQAAGHGLECVALLRLAISETDLMIDSIDSIADLLRRGPERTGEASDGTTGWNRSAREASWWSSR
jgi:uncharacterized membrane protein YccC